MSEPTKSRRPWWANAIAGGVGIGLGLAASAFAGQHGGPDPDRLTRIEDKVDKITDRLSHIEGRLERR